MNWLLFILKLVPYIGAGVNAVHSDLSADQKTKVATDLIQLGAAATGQVSPDHADLATAISATAVSSVGQVVNALHNHNSK